MYRILATACVSGCLILAQTCAETATAADELAAPVDSCALLSPSDISRVLDRPVSAGVRDDTGFASDGSYSSTCLWTIETEDAASDLAARPQPGSFVILNVVRWPDGSDLARTFLEAFRKAAGSGELPSQPTPREFGDEALWWGDGLAVRKDEVSFGISVFVPVGSSGRPGALEEKLAGYILRRLDGG